MNGDALSDLILAFTCGWIAAREYGKRPGIAIAVMIIGIAAVLGIFRFAGFEWAFGPHAFSSTFAALAGTVLLAFSLNWPEDPIARNTIAATRFALILGALAIVAFVNNFGWINWFVITGAIVSIILSSLRDINFFRLCGVAFMVGGGIIGNLANATTGYFGALSHIQVMHILLALALIMLTHTSKLRRVT